MQFNRQFLLIALSFILTTGLSAQKHLAKAERQFELKAFDLAIENAKRAIEKDPQCIACHHLIAEAFRMKNENVDAAIWYRKMEQFNDLPSDYAFNYGLLLKRMGQYSKAKKYFNEYKIIDNEKATYFAQSCDFAMETLSADRDFELNLFGVSSRYTDFGTSIFKDRIVFSSFRPDFKRNISNTSTSSFDKHKCQFFIADNDYKSDVNSMQFLLKNDVETYDMGPIHYASDAPICAVTRHNFNDGEKQVFSDDLELSLYLAEVNLDGSFSELIPFPYNEVGYATGFGTLNPRGNILYFSSNRPGGQGGFDIYVSYFKNGKWTYPANLGPQINTAGNEITPFFDGAELYYSSDYTTGLGGLDVFNTSVVDGAWKTPVNMKNGVNSPEDDYYFIKHPGADSYYLTSNRLGGRGSYDIYLVHKIRKHEVQLEYTINESIPQAVNLDEDLSSVSTAERKQVSFEGSAIDTDPGKGSPIKDTKIAIPTESTNPVTPTTETITNQAITTEAIATETINAAPSAPAAIDFNELLPPKAVDLNRNNSKTISLAGAKRVAYGEVIRSSSNVYFIQLAALFKNQASVSKFTNLVEYGSLYKVRQSSATKIKLGYFMDKNEAKEVLRQVKARGHSDAFITYEALNTSKLELVTVSENNNKHYDGNTYYDANSTGDNYKVRLASYEDPIWFDVTKINDVGVIEQWSKGEWTIFVMSGFSSLEAAEMARVTAINRGFPQAEVVRDRNGILEKIN